MTFCPNRNSESRGRNKTSRLSQKRRAVFEHQGYRNIPDLGMNAIKTTTERCQPKCAFLSLLHVFLRFDFHESSRASALLAPCRVRYQTSGQLSGAISFDICDKTPDGHDNISSVIASEREKDDCKQSAMEMF